MMVPGASFVPTHGPLKLLEAPHIIYVIEALKERVMADAYLGVDFLTRSTF